MQKIACVGIMVADVMVKPVCKFPDKGQLQLVDAVTLHSGGNAMTAALNLAKLGARPTLVGKVGNDSFGRFLLETLDKNGVNSVGVTRSDSYQTACSVVLSAPDGERSFLHCTGANAALQLADINTAIIQHADIIFVTGSFLLDSLDGAPTAELLRQCKALGKITALDVCWDGKDRWLPVMEQALPYIDIFMPSIEEAQRLSGLREPTHIAAFFFDKGVGSIVIKLGKDGCYLQQSKDSIGCVLPTYSRVKVVDTTGAGDSFCSGFLMALACGEKFVDCARFANAVGSHCVMAKGATAGIKSYREIREFMEENPI